MLTVQRADHSRALKGLTHQKLAPGAELTVQGTDDFTQLSYHFHIQPLLSRPILPNPFLKRPDRVVGTTIARPKRFGCKYELQVITVTSERIERAYCITERKSVFWKTPLYITELKSVFKKHFSIL